MTPEYASPEQVRGDPITPASDIYSLGVLLYRLLTGHRPYAFPAHTPQAMERVICAAPPEKPSKVIYRVEAEPAAQDETPRPLTPAVVAQTRGETPKELAHRLAGDLGNILLMALRKEPERRYASAEQFSEDLGRYLEIRPIVARRDTLGYRGAKFVQRNRTAVV